MYCICFCYRGIYTIVLSFQRDHYWKSRRLTYSYIWIDCSKFNHNFIITFTGFFLYDFFIGHELNPRIGSLDLKFFCELRPGLIGWVMFDLAFLVQARQEYGHVPHALLLIVAFHTLYVADALWYEVSI